MELPTVDWNFAHRPDPRDEVIPLAELEHGEGKPVSLLLFNKTKGFFYIEHDGSYGTLVLKEE